MDEETFVRRDAGDKKVAFGTKTEKKFRLRTTRISSIRRKTWRVKRMNAGRREILSLLGMEERSKMTAWNNEQRMLEKGREKKKKEVPI